VLGFYYCAECHIFIAMLNIFMLSVIVKMVGFLLIILSVTFYSFAERHREEGRYTECRGAIQSL
jgi:hypothetical protein